MSKTFIPNNALKKEILVVRLSNKQKAAMHASRRDGRALAKKHPEIADAYRKKGATYKALVAHYAPGLEPGTGETVVKYAIYKLIPKKERNSINSVRQKERGKECGTRNFENGGGFAGLPKRAHKKVSQQGARASNIARGRVLYDGAPRRTNFGKMTEKEFIKKLMDMTPKSEPYRWKLIAAIVNVVFKNSRSVESVSELFRKKK